MKPTRSLPLLALFVLAAAPAADAAVHRVSPGESIQAAIDAASPGDTILVKPGTYEETGNARYGLEIRTDDLRLIGLVKKHLGEAGKVRLVATGSQETGVYAAPSGPGDCEYDDSEEECEGELQGFYIRGFSVEGFPVNGIQTRWVNGFQFIQNESIDNLNNGIYPTLSANGLVANNFSYGSLDTALWVAASENVRVIGNELTGAPTGLEITVSNDVLAVLNDIHDNTVGVGLYHPNAAGNGPKPVMANWVIKFNRIHDNNLANPAPVGSFQSGLLPGYGVLLLGVSDHVVSGNYIANNGGAGIAVLGWCTATALGDPSRNCENDPPIADPSSNNNRFAFNVLNGNGGSPPPIGLPGVDILYVQTPPFEPGVGNCFQQNVFDSFLSLPDGFFGPPAAELPTDGC